MQGEPYDWNVVAAGAWNPAILTPDGISTHMFQNAHGTPIQIDVPLDRNAPIRVRHGGLVVTPSAGRIVANSVENTSAGLQAAGEVCARAIEWLGLTPLTAAGVNIRWRFDAASQPMWAVINSALDPVLADSGFNIRARTVKRAVDHHEGLLNIETSALEDATTVSMNFHRDSTAGPTLAAWLRATEDMVNVARSVVEAIGEELAEGDK